MMKKNNKRIVALILMIMTLFSSFSGVFAQTEISSAGLYDKGDCEYHLQYWNEEQGMWFYVTCNLIVYNLNGIEYPAYCVDRGLPRNN